MAIIGTGCLLSIWCCAVLALPDSASVLRPQSVRLLHVIEWAIQDSPTFRALTETLAAHRMVIWITPDGCDGDRHPACLHHRITISGGYRFLFVSVRDDMPRLRVAGWIAHELQHAVEVADAEITTADGFDALYRRIGEPCGSEHVQQCRETRAAIDVENGVLGELSALHTAQR